jgi:hypothetical protein
MRPMAQLRSCRDGHPRMGRGNIPPAEAEAHYYVQIDESAMVA